MKNKSMVLAICLMIISLVACQSNSTEKNKAKENTIAEPSSSLIDDPRSPNPSSELAVLMRDMWEYGDTIKMALLEKDSFPDYRTAFKEVHEAIPTEAKTKTPAFDAMASVMLKQLDNFYAQTEHDKKVEGFNLLIKSCLQCHEQQCPGPTSKISKLLIAKK